MTNPPTTLRLPPELMKEMRHHAVELGLRFPSELVIFLWEYYKRTKSEKENEKK